MDESEHFPSLSQISLIWMPGSYFKISKVIWLINGKFLNQPMKFPLLCRQCVIWREFSKLFLNCPVTCTYFILSCSPLHSWLGFCILLWFFQLFRLQVKFSRKWYMDHLLNCFPCPGIFSPSHTTFKTLMFTATSFLLWSHLGCALNQLSPGSILDTGKRGTLFWFPLSLLKL